MLLIAYLLLLKFEGSERELLILKLNLLIGLLQLIFAFFHFMAHVLFASRHLSLQLSELIVVDELPTYLAVKIVLIELGSFVDIELSHLFLDDSYFLQFYVVGFQSLVMEF